MNKLTLIIIGILILLCIGIGIYAVVEKTQKEEAQQKLTIIGKDTIKTSVEPVKIYTDSMGEKHVVIAGDANKVAQKNINTIGEGTVKLLDSAALALNLSIGDRDKITQLTKIVTETTGENILLKRTIDSLNGKVVTLYKYKDKYLDLTVSKTDTGNNLTADYKFNDDITYVDYLKKKWFLGVNHSFTDLYSTNPNTTIKGVSRLTIEHPLSTFGLRLKTSGAYNFQNKELSVGPGMELDFGNKIDASFLYLRNLSNNIWIPVIRLDYNLINF